MWDPICDKELTLLGVNEAPQGGCHSHCESLALRLLTQVSYSDIEYHYLIQNNRFCAEAQGSPGIGRRTGPRASRASQGMPPGYFKRSIDKSTAVTVEKSFQCRHVKVKRTFRSEIGPFLVATRMAGIGCRGAREGRALQGVEYLYGGNCRRP